MHQAVAHVLIQQTQGHGLKRLGRGADLGQDVDAVLVLLDHPRDPPDLPLDAGQSLEMCVLGPAVAGSIGVHADTVPGEGNG